MKDSAHPARPFGARVREHRKARGLTQQQLADLTKTTRQTVGNWENERWGITAEALATLADALQVTPSELHPDPDNLSATGGDIADRPPTGSNTQRISRLEKNLAALQQAFDGLRAELVEGQVIDDPPADAVLPILRRVAGQGEQRNGEEAAQPRAGLPRRQP